MELFEFSTVISLFFGIGLAAAAGFRVFLPLFVLSVAVHFGLEEINIGEQFAWVGSWPAMITLGVAMLTEILAYYIPLVDNALDAIVVPLASIAGTFLVGSTLVEMNELTTWVLAIIAGGGTAATISSGTAATRAASTATTGGAGNFLVNTGETATASMLSITSIIWAPIAFILALISLFFVGKVLRRINRFKKNIF